MEVVTLPPTALSPLTDTVASWQYLDDSQTPVDFLQSLDGANWSCEFLIENCRCVVYRASAVLDQDGGVSVTIPQNISAALRSDQRIDAEIQLNFTAPVADMNMIWRGPLTVLEVTL